MLVHQRRLMWMEDMLERLAAWMGLRHGMTAVDIGCGLGYLGYTYWPYFGKGGHYYGVDRSSSLLRDAWEASRGWAAGGQATFLQGSVYALPLDDNTVDWAVCQAVLMHLEHPAHALKEMLRVVKPGGLIVCKEPDHLGGALGKGHWSIPDLPLEEELLLRRKAFLCHAGRVKLGRGDHHIGPKIPHMMRELGLTDVDVRTNDRPFYLEPPYETEWQRYRLESFEKRFMDKKAYKTLVEEEKEEFLAGGGTQREYDRYWECAERIVAIVREQLKNSEYFVCAVPQMFVTKGRKPVDPR
jgi:SAM-dependent methyltransferase